MFHKAETLNKLLVVGFLVVHGQSPQQRKGRTLSERVSSLGPRFELVPGVRCAIEEVKAHRVTDAPVIEITTPAVHAGPWRSAARPQASPPRDYLSQENLRQDRERLRSAAAPIKATPAEQKQHDDDQKDDFKSNP